MSVTIPELRQVLAEELRTSVPQLQARWELRYSEARQMVTVLIHWGWLDKEPQGIHYRVLQENLQLRHMERQEVEDFYPQMDGDMAAVLATLVKRHCCRFTDLEAAVRGKRDTERALEKLREYSMIRLWEERYFLTISKELAGLLVEIHDDSPSGLCEGDEDLWLEHVKQRLDIFFADAN